MSKNVCLIVAKASNGAIGNDNTLLWRLPADLQRFKDITMGHPIIMGRKTYESIGRPLPGRQNIVITRNSSFTAPGCMVVGSLKEAIAIASDDQVFIIGGGEVYSQSLPFANRLFVTEVEAAPVADTFFAFDEQAWNEIRREYRPKDAQNQYNVSFVTYQRASE